MKVRFLKEVAFPGHPSFAVGQEVEAAQIPFGQAQPLLACGFVEPVEETPVPQPVPQEES